MDTPEEAVDYDSMDHSDVNRIFVSDLLELGAIGERILDLGTGTAQIPIELCERVDDCHVTAVDLAREMLEVARYNIEANGLIQRIELMHVDAKSLELDDELFDSVISNSIVHHVPEPISVLREAVRVARDGGWLFFRDLTRPEDEATLRHLVDTYTPGANEHQKSMFADSLHAALTLDEIQQLVQELGFEADTVSMTTDRHWTWAARKE